MLTCEFSSQKQTYRINDKSSDTNRMWQYKVYAFIQRILFCAIEINALLSVCFFNFSNILYCQPTNVYGFPEVLLL